MEHGVVEQHLALIPDHQIGIGADADAAFARIQPVESGRIGRGQFDELIDRHASAKHALGIEQRHARLPRAGPLVSLVLVGVIGLPVHLREEISTGDAARLELTFDDGTTLTLGEKARLVIDEFVYNPADGLERMAVSASGAFRFVSGALKRPTSEVSVATPVDAADQLAKMREAARAAAEAQRNQSE